MRRFAIVRAVFRSLRLPLILFFIITLTGVVGFQFIEGFSFHDALYMTIITESTVGFSEVQPLSPEGKYFTIFLIISSFGIFAFAISSVTSYITSGDYKKTILIQKHRQRMKNLSGHTIVCGYGRVGKRAIQDLEKHNYSFLLIEREIFKSEDHDFLTIKGDATEDELLIQAGIESAANIIVALPSDSDNLMIVVTARALNKKINIVTRVSSKSNESKLKNAGADHIISPDKVGGIAMARMVTKPDLMEFMDQITAFSVDEVSLDEVIYFGTQGGDRTILDFAKNDLAGCLIVGYKNKENKFVVNPSVDTVIPPGTKLFVLGRKEQIKKLHINLGN